MATRIGILEIGLLAAATGWGASFPPAGVTPDVAGCAGEIAAMHGVWTSPESFLPFHGDWDLMVYLTAVQGGDTRVPVLAVYSPEPLYFRSKGAVFLSTGFILRAGSEQELKAAMVRAPLTVVSRTLPACASMPLPGNTTFIQIQRRLSDQLTGYDDPVHRRLRIRARPTREPGL